LPLLAVVQFEVQVLLLVLVLLGAFQKSPQPARSGAAANSNHAHFPIFIATPLHRFQAEPFSGNLLTEYRLDAHSVLLALRARAARYCVRRIPAGIRLARPRPFDSVRDKLQRGSSCLG